MPTADHASRYVNAQARIIADAQRKLAQAWLNLASDPVLARQQVAELIGFLSQSHGPVSAEIAAQYYEFVRGLAQIEDRFTAQVVVDIDADKVAKDAGWASKPIENGDRTAAFLRAQSIVQRLVQQWGRDTVIHNAARDPAKPRFARVPFGKTCAFCRLMASRGAVYLTAASAGELNRFHADCDCQIVQSYSPDDLPYDPGPYVEEYAKARQAAGSGDPKAILSQMRKSDASRGGVDRNGVKLHQHEIDTGGRLAKLGFDVKFQPRADGKKSADADLAGLGRWELKSPTGGSENTIANQLRSVHEQSALVVLDLTRIGRSIPEAFLDVEQAFSRYTRVQQVMVIHEHADGTVRIVRRLER